ncbi:MAG TPA: FtsX-like permease family protein, partial [Pirellulales bacterium]|nr:FtsX-like permease family protein [Pirellulales bacterium]
NTQLANQLNVHVGDAVNLQIGQANDIPGDSPLGRKTDTIRRKQLRVSEVIPTEGLGRFGLHPSQQLPANAYVGLATVQAMLDKPDRANAILVASQFATNDLDQGVAESIVAVRPTLADYGLRLDEVQRKDGDRTVTHYLNLTSDRMLLDPPVVEAAQRAWRDQTIQEVLTYLANWIAGGNQKLPYSTITAVDSVAELGPLLEDNGQPVFLKEDGIAVTDWATRNQHLTVSVGDPVTITYFAPDTTHGQVEEDHARFRLAAIVPLGGDGQPITPANDPAFTPEVPGVTDQESIDDWDPPFPFDATRIRDDRDDAYWKKYRATPKAFVSLDAGRRLWGSRFGDTTSIRVLVGPTTNRDQLARQLLAEISPETLGFEFRPIKLQALRAASGTTPFDVLFLMFSGFLIAAALMLVSLLFRLGIEQRISDVGLMTAVGFKTSSVTRTLAAEGLIVASVGALTGMIAGLGYAALMLVGLRTWWVDAVSTPFLQLHATAPSLAIGFLGGLIVCGITIVLTLRRATRLPPTSLLAGKIEDYAALSGSASRRSRWIAIVALLLACGLIPVAMGQGGGVVGGGGGEIQAGAFFAAGALVLLSGLLWIRDRLRAAGSVVSTGRPSGALWLAERNAARNPGRSTLTIGLVASASFLIIAISAFRLDETDAGGGGYNLIGQSASPLYYELTSEEGQFQLGIDQPTARMLDESDSVGLRVRPGQDASCLNLYRPDKPRVLGVPNEISADFSWASRGGAANNPWDLLRQPLPPGDNADGIRTVPVILDQNTAMYSLHLWKGVGESL